MNRNSSFRALLRRGPLVARGRSAVTAHTDVLLAHAKSLDKEGAIGREALDAGGEAIGVIYSTYAAMQDAAAA